MNATFNLGLTLSMFCSRVDDSATIAVLMFNA